MTAPWRVVADFSRVAWNDLTHRVEQSAVTEARLLEAEAWLCRAHDATPDGGVSYGYSLRGGWRPSYPETSGYIATTFLRLARDRDAGYLDRACRVLRWLSTVQRPDGSFANARFGDDGIVFDTGQVLFGLVAGYERTGETSLLEAARRAAAWLVRIADADRRWTRNEFLNTPHVYNTRTAWALLRMNSIEFERERERVARANLDWAVASQQRSGFFDHCAFESGKAPFTHTIAYATRGLLESALLLGDDRYLAAARRSAYATLDRLRDDGFLPSTITVRGEADSTSCCLTGNCQFAIVWARLHVVQPDPRLAMGLNRALGFVGARQDLVSSRPGVRGGIKGSHPIWGRYAPMSYPNWSTKFFIDAMWLRKRLIA